MKLNPNIDSQDLNMKKIYFLLPGLGFGGAERVIFTLCNELDRKKFKPTLVVFNKEGMPLEFLKPDVKVINLNINRIRYALFPLIQLLRKDKPDIVFGGWGEVSAYLSPIIPFFRKIKFVARETNVVSEHVQRKVIRMFYKFYNNFDKIIAQSDDMQKDLIENFNIKSHKLVKINNPVDVDWIQNQMEIEDVEFSEEFSNVVAIGNLSERKGFDLLLNVFSYLKEEKIKLHILGDGADKEKLFQLKNELGLEKVEFLGIKENPFPYLKAADLFVLSSRYEGFPNVLLEAGACGTYALANDCLGGINEIIQEGINGEILPIENAEQFAKKVKELCSQSFESKLIQNSIASRYSKEIILEQYDKELSEI